MRQICRWAPAWSRPRGHRGHSRVETPHQKVGRTGTAWGILESTHTRHRDKSRQSSQKDADEVPRASKNVGAQPSHWAPETPGGCLSERWWNLLPATHEGDTKLFGSSSGKLQWCKTLVGKWHFNHTGRVVFDCHWKLSSWCPRRMWEDQGTSSSERWAISCVRLSPSPWQQKGRHFSWRAAIPSQWDAGNFSNGFQRWNSWGDMEATGTTSSEMHSPHPCIRSWSNWAPCTTLGTILSEVWKEMWRRDVDVCTDSHPCGKIRAP